MKLLICPIEIVMQLKEHQGWTWLKDVLFRLIIRATTLNEILEVHLPFSCDAKVHHEVKVGEPVSIELAYGVVHLVLLSLRRSECLSLEVTIFIGVFDIFMEELINCGEFLLIGGKTI